MNGIISLFPADRTRVRTDPIFGQALEVTFRDHGTIVLRIFEVLGPAPRPFRVYVRRNPAVTTLIQQVIDNMADMIEWEDSSIATADNIDALRHFVMNVAFQLDKCRLQPVNQGSNQLLLNNFIHFSRYITFVGGSGSVLFPPVRTDIIEADKRHASSRCIQPGPWDDQHYNFERGLNFIQPLENQNININEFMLSEVGNVLRGRVPTDRLTVSIGKCLFSSMSPQIDINSIFTATNLSQMSTERPSRQLKSEFTPCLPVCYSRLLVRQLTTCPHFQLTETRTDVVISLYFPRIFQSGVSRNHIQRQPGRIKLKFRGIDKEPRNAALCVDTTRKATIAYAGPDPSKWDFKINHVGMEREYTPSGVEEERIVRSVQEYMLGAAPTSGASLEDRFSRLEMDDTVWGHVGRIDVYEHSIFQNDTRGIEIDIVRKYCRRIVNGPMTCGVTLEWIGSKRSELTANDCILDALYLMNLVNQLQS